VRSRVCQAKPIRAAAPASGHLLAARHHVPAGFAKVLARPSREAVCIHLTVHAFIGLPAIPRRAHVLFPSRANADSPRRRVSHIVFDCPRHDAVRVRQTRAFTSTTEQADRQATTGATRTRVAGQLSLQSRRCPASLPCVCCCGMEMPTQKKTRHHVLGLREYGHGIIMSMLAKSERITVGWLARTPFSARSLFNRTCTSLRL
jgi:hypothetical protein